MLKTDDLRITSFSPRRPQTQSVQGAEILYQSLLEEGVDTIFGYTGASILSILDQIQKIK
jgi:hypothetical protein